MADHINEIGSYEQVINSIEDGRPVVRRIVREYRVLENANDRGMLRVEFTDAYAEPGSDFLGSRGWVHETDHKFAYGDII